MSARIMIDLERVHPVFGGRWHRVHLRRLPQPGEPVTTLCGATEPAEYEGGSDDQAAATCWSCDLVYRREQNIPVLPDHPGLSLPTPRPRH